MINHEIMVVDNCTSSSNHDFGSSVMNSDNTNNTSSNDNNYDNSNNDEIKMPKKKYFRTRAHCNPLSNNDGFSYPLSPDQYNWQLHYPNIDISTTIINDSNENNNDTGGSKSSCCNSGYQVSILDIGMGFGGLSVELSQLFPDKLILGKWEDTYFKLYIFCRHNTIIFIVVMINSIIFHINFVIVILYHHHNNY